MRSIIPSEAPDVILSVAKNLVFPFRVGAIRLAIATAILALAGFGRPALADTPDMRGRWVGFAHSEMNPGPWSQDWRADVMVQNRTSFSGQATLLPAVQRPLPFRGNLMEGNFLKLFGDLPDVGRFVARGRMVETNPGPVQLPAVRLVGLEYFVMDSAGNLLDHGYVLLLHDQNGKNWANPGPTQIGNMEWMGTWTSAMNRNSDGQPFMGTADLMTGDQRGSAFGAQGDFMNVFYPPTNSFFDVFFNVAGTVGLPAVQRDGSKLSPLAAIGNDPPDPVRPGVISILIGLLTDPPDPVMPQHIQAQYRLYDSFFDVFTDIMKNMQGGTAFDGGHVEAVPCI